MRNITVQDVFCRFYPDYIDLYTPSPRQAKTAHHIMNCKTGAYGTNVSVCESCGHVEFHHNSCRDRNCPMCQELPKERWLDAQREYLLDVPYYHVVFTIPHELNPVVYCNQKTLYGLLFRAAADTLLELTADAKHLGAKPGFTSILHTWGSDMGYHPHLHLLITGGGLAPNDSWSEKKEFFLPVRVMSRVFRGRFMAELKELKSGNELVFEGQASKYCNQYAFKELLDVCYGKEWVPYCKESYGGAESVMEYIGRYTHRIAVSNSRILSVDEKTVTFRVKDYKNGGAWNALTLTGVEFIRRFLMHVLPKGFVKIRHYGLLSNRNKKTKIALCRNIIGCLKYLSKLKGLDGEQVLKVLYGIDAYSCPHCKNRLIRKTGRRLMQQPAFVT